MSGSAHEGAAVDLPHAIPILRGLNPRRHRTRAGSTAAPPEFLEWWRRQKLRLLVVGR
ncbi:hypothetical protein ACFXO9_31370 [Nocardia tengchongensis]|uniref:hypothetical protein n=1 Tax=Nocardia tengchongensis TaxID=2055889 RepID=UPI0036C3CC85